MMERYLKNAIHMKCSLIEISLLIELNKNYPKFIAIDDVQSNEDRHHIAYYLKCLKEKGFVEERIGELYKIKKEENWCLWK
ncbi:hypothetical protein [Virgibacillus salexigens]|uniref:hypothetical protein n=1 Tax=Virgibacillus TaxID=84406 RepID=UPI00136A9F7A|nr:hypothetical protein [Virgibacillus massiliensis]MYL42095.1 hypothetical protein [Virgibacillus massiliensis]